MKMHTPFRGMSALWLAAQKQRGHPHDAEGCVPLLTAKTATAMPEEMQLICSTLASFEMWCTSVRRFPPATPPVGTLPASTCSSEPSRTSSGEKT